MLRLKLISCIVAVWIVTYGSLCYAQERSVGPYFGVSGSLGESIDIRDAYSASVGWGIEAGMHFRPFYAGLEYGTYADLYQPVLTYDPTIGSVPSPEPGPSATEQFWGVHAGYVFTHDSLNHNSIYVGFVVLKSYQPWERWDSISGWVTFTKSYLNIGPDFRYSGIDDGHIYLASAFTIRRGLKIGIGYMF